MGDGIGTRRIIHDQDTERHPTEEHMILWRLQRLWKTMRIHIVEPMDTTKSTKHRRKPMHQRQIRDSNKWLERMRKMMMMRILKFISGSRTIYERWMTMMWRNMRRCLLIMDMTHVLHFGILRERVSPRWESIAERIKMKSSEPFRTCHQVT